MQRKLNAVYNINKEKCDWLNTDLCTGLVQEFLYDPNFFVPAASGKHFLIYDSHSKLAIKHFGVLRGVLGKFKILSRVTVITLLNKMKH